MNWQGIVLIVLVVVAVWLSGRSGYRAGYINGQLDCAKEIYLFMYKAAPETFEGEHLAMAKKFLEEEEGKKE